MNAYLIYHPERKVLKLDQITVYHDKFNGNQDPYIWNEKFLHTYCHMPIVNEENQINFWVSDARLKYFTHLNCDCVFVIEKAYYWKDSNSIGLNEAPVDNLQTFEHHYKWHTDHPLEKRKRYTLKANPEMSFQPQCKNRMLIDIVPFLLKQGFTLDDLHKEMILGFRSKPFKIDEKLGKKLYKYLYDKASIKLYGYQLASIHPHGIDSNSTKSSGKCC